MDEETEETIVERTASRAGSRRGRASVPWASAGMGGIVAILLIWPAWASLYTEWLWFRELGYEGVFSKVLSAKMLLAFAAGALAAAVAWLNLRLALRLSPSPQPGQNQKTIRAGEMDLPLPDMAAALPRMVPVVSLLIGAVAGMAGWGAWDMVLRFRHQQPFGAADPIFGRDIGFYFFTLPALDWAAGFLFALCLALMAGVAGVYALGRAAGAGGEQSSILRQGPSRKHLLCLGSALFLILAWQTYLAMPNLLFSAAGPVAGATYTDLAARLPMLWVKFAAGLLAAALAALCLFRATNRLFWSGVGVYGLSLVCLWIFPAALQRLSVAPNELVKETPYIKLNIAATRAAFGLDRVEEREVTGEKPLTAADIQANQRTIQNIRLWDQQPLLDTFGQIQEIRTYYEFHSVDNDRYQIGGETQQVMLSPRELSAASLPNRNWINERLTFTHGFGLTVGPVAKGTAEGLPVLFVKDIPPVSSVESLRVARPEIYFGELSHSPVYVKTNVKEFNHPAGEENVFTTYAGEGGVAVGSTWRKLLFATRFRDLKLLLSDDLRADSRVLYYRAIGERLGKVAPYLRFDGDPYLVIADGKLHWIVDAYTLSDRYPYSQPAGRGVNYIRNAVKAVVDAYDGSVRLYIADERDPVIQTYARAFQGTLRPLEEMPAELRSHLRYPEDIFRLQTAVYSTYHMDQPQVFYNKEDLWTVASVGGSGEGAAAQAISPYYTIMRLPGEAAEEFILMLPFTPQRKDNLAAWMVARADGENYGRLVVYRFPKQRLIFGPKQVVARINQDPEISRQITLWSQHGSQVILGTLMVIPIEESLIYVQPLYLRAVTGKIPELRRVIVAAENRIAMEATLDASLARVFGAAAQPGAPEPKVLLTGAQPATESPQATATGQLSAQARMHYDRMVQAQRDGDWARFGEELKQLGSVIERLAGGK